MRYSQYEIDNFTEILTKDGWKYGKDINQLSDKVFTRELNTKLLQFQSIKNIEVKQFNGEVYQYIGRQINICLSATSNIGISQTISEQNNSEIKTTVEKFLGIIDSKKFIKAGAIWNGTNQNIFNICGETFDGILFARLLGIFLTDGTVNNQGCITISQRKQNIVTLIIKLLTDLKIKHSIYLPSTKKNCYTFYIARKYLPFFRQFYLKEKRVIPEEFKNASVPILSSLIEGILDGDSDNERRKIYIGSKSLVDDVQECLYKIGVASNYAIKSPKSSYLKSEDRYIVGKKDYYVISILKTKNPTRVDGNLNIIKHKGLLYHIKIEDKYSILTRREGKTVWI